ncbi:Keratin-associated protein 10-8, partial [Ophiophagus hannah]
MLQPIDPHLFSFTMSYGWNNCYPNCTPVTVTLQPPPFSMNIPSSSLCCPDQYACIDPCRPCSPTVCSTMVCSPTVCGPSMCAPKACGPAACGPAHCGPVSCAPVSCGPVSCAPVSCGPVSCGPVSCAPVSCAPVVCGPAFSRSRYNSYYNSCSLPSRKCLPRVQTICDPCTKY